MGDDQAYGGHAQNPPHDATPQATSVRAATTPPRPPTQAGAVLHDPNDGWMAAPARPDPAAAPQHSPSGAVAHSPSGAVAHSPSGAVAHSPEARLQVLAGMVTDVRTQLHSILGGTQLLQLHGSLESAQSGQVDMILAAGTKLLRTLNQAADIAQSAATPAEAPPPTAEATDTTAQAGPPAGKPDRVLRILVVDDVATNREIASTFVRAAGHEVQTATGGAAAVTAAAAHDFDVILMDVGMPNVDGLQASRLIRALPGARGRVPIVALTAYTSAEHVEACRDMGMNGYLAKPFRYDTLVEALHRAHSEMPIRRPAADMPASGTADGQFARAYGNYIRSEAASPDATFQPPTPRAGAPRADAPQAGAPQADASRTGAPASTWIDIASPWDQAPRDRGQESYILDTQFHLKLTAVGQKGSRALAAATPLCQPPEDQAGYEFHWLIYVDPMAGEGGSFRAPCDLWRWSGTVWRSIAPGGAKFTPDELYTHGWRYCGPCIEKTAIVEVL
jgi:CheY-like chemotaxis protein